MIAAVSRKSLAQLSLAFVLATSAAAQGRHDVEAFEPAPQVEGSVLSLYGARSIKPGGFSVSLFGSYASVPLDVKDPDGEQVGTLVDSVSTVQLLGAVGLFERVDLGVAIALHHTSEGSDFGDPRLDVASLQASKLAFGDIRVAPRVSIVEHAGSSGIDLALVLPMWLPTGNDASYAGEPFRIEPRLALDYHSDAAVIVLNAGYMARSKQPLVNTEADDQIKLGLGGDVRIAGGFGVLAELDTRLNVLAGDFGDEDIDSELLAGLRYKAGGFRAQLGAGPGISHAITSPEYRVFAGLSYSHEPEERAESAPPPAPVDRDSDGDGVPDAVDRCADQAEDTDGFQDEDGCPDADNDGDGVADAADNCNGQAEDKDGFQDEDGCPDADNDGDGIADASDRCPLEAGSTDSSGCPAPAAPPPAAQPAAPEPVELTQVIRFDKNRSVISGSYSGTLDEIAKLLKEHPEVEVVAVEGHADDRGSPELNDKLSSARAESVRAALVTRGIAKKRLTARGFGTTRPVAGNDTDDSRAQNRRVELRIEKRASQNATP
jgi:outer membrane protein OmpA-like peptidoglycan-associated protein